MSTLRVTATLGEVLGKQLDDLAARENRTPAKMATILIQQGINYRLRKRKTLSSVKENHSQHNPAD